MASVIRLLPKRKLQRHTEPYTRKFARVSTRRFLHAVFIVIVAAALVAVPGAALLRRPFLQTWLVYAGCASVTAVMYKLALAVELPRAPSAAEGVAHELLARANYVLLAGFAASVVGFFTLLRPEAAYYTKRVVSQSTPAGIPESLKLHRVNKWYVLDEEFYYLSSFLAIYTLGHVLWFVFTGRRALDVRDSERGVRPFDRLVRRAPAVAAHARAFVLAAAAFPVFYFAVLRPLRATPLRMFGVVELSGFKPQYALRALDVAPLVCGWSFAYECFMAYLTLGPIYRGKPISATATDSTGCLLTGLQTAPRKFAALVAWDELLQLATRFPERRRALFADVDEDRVAWVSVKSALVGMLREQAGRLQAEPKQKPPAASKGAPKRPRAPSSSRWLLAEDPHAVQQARDSVEVHSAPASVCKAPSGPVSRLDARLEALARRLESDSDATVARAHAAGARLLARLRGSLHTLCIRVFRVAPAQYFARTFDRELSARLPHVPTTRCALQAVAALVEHAVAEDEHGYVQESVGEILLEIDGVLGRLAAVLRTPHEHLPALASPVPEPLAPGPGLDRARLLEAELESAFAAICSVFGPYFSDMKIAPAVLRRARGEKAVPRLADAHESKPVNDYSTAKPSVESAWTRRARAGDPSPSANATSNAGEYLKA